MERLLVICLCLMMFGCTEPDDEETFKAAEKIYTNTGFVSAVAFDENERIICLGVEEGDGSIVTTSLSSINKDDILSFRSSNEFLLVQNAPGNIEIEENCVYVERGYAESPKESVEVGVIAYTVEAEKIDEK